MSVPVFFYGLAFVALVLFVWFARASNYAATAKAYGIMWFYLVLSFAALVSIPFLVAYGAGAE